MLHGEEEPREETVQHQEKGKQGIPGRRNKNIYPDNNGES